MTPMETMQSEIDALKAEVAALKQSGSVWQGVSGWFKDHPAFSHALYAVAYAALGAGLSYFSGLTTVTKTVEGPEKVIVREVPVEKTPAGTSKQKADTVP